MPFVAIYFLFEKYFILKLFTNELESDYMLISMTHCDYNTHDICFSLAAKKFLLGDLISLKVHWI